MKRRAGRACDLARDKIAGVAFVKRGCRRLPTGTCRLRVTCALEGHQVTKSVIAMRQRLRPWQHYRARISACALQIDAPSNVSIRRERLALEGEESNRRDDVSGSANVTSLRGRSLRCAPSTGQPVLCGATAGL
jgi:hypothetical protein